MKREKSSNRTVEIHLIYLKLKINALFNKTRLLAQIIKASPKNKSGYLYKNIFAENTENV